MELESKQPDIRLDSGDSYKGEKPKKNRPVGLKHRKTLLHQLVFYDVFDSIYCPKNDEKTGDPLWYNTVESLEKKYSSNQDGSLILGCKPNQANIRNILHGYYNDGDGVLECFSDAHNKYGFYPKESVDGFCRYLDLIAESSEKNQYERLTRTHVNYFIVCFNREFILSLLKRTGCRFKLRFVSGNRHFETEMPIVGRYRKIYEMTDVLEDYISKLRDLESLLESGNPVSCRTLADAIIDQKEFVEGFSEDIFDDERVAHSLKDIRGFVEFLEKRKENMDFLRSKSKHGQFVKDFRFRDIFTEDREFIFRREALWEDMVLDGEDLSVFCNNPFYEIINGERVPLQDHELIYSFVKSYCQTIDNLVILPMLCLTELSPSALQFLLKYSREVKDQVLELDKLGSELDLVLDRLLLKAWKDVVNNKTFYNVSYEPSSVLFISLDGRYKTRLYRVGDVQLNNSTRSAVLTFIINDGRYLSVNYTQQINPVVPKYCGQLYWSTPAAVPIEKQNPWPWDHHIRTREWLVELFEKYAQHITLIDPDLYQILDWHLHTDYAKRDDY